MRREKRQLYRRRFEFKMTMLVYPMQTMLTPDLANPTGRPTAAGHLCREVHAASALPQSPIVIFISLITQLRGLLYPVPSLRLYLICLRVSKYEMRLTLRNI